MTVSEMIAILSTLDSNMVVKAPCDTVCLSEVDKIQVRHDFVEIIVV